MIMPYLQFHGNCEEAIQFYANVFDGEITSLARFNNDPSNPIMHATVTFAEFNGGISGSDVDNPVEISGMAILLVIPSRERIIEIIPKLVANGVIVQGFMPHPPPHDHDGGAEVRDQFGYTWYLST